MKASDSGLGLIRSQEGLRLEAYPDGKTPDGAQRYSIGYGHSGAHLGQRISMVEAERLFREDVARFESALTAVLSEGATQGQFDALVSLAYNIGAKAFADSTLIARHNVGDFKGAAAEFRRWNKSDGHVNPVLVERREIESQRYAQASPGYPWVEAEPAPVAAASVGLGLLFFCPYCRAECVAHFSAEKSERCSSLVDHLGTVVQCELRAAHVGDHMNDRLKWTTERAFGALAGKA